MANPNDIIYSKRNASGTAFDEKTLVPVSGSFVFFGKCDELTTTNLIAGANVTLSFVSGNFVISTTGGGSGSSAPFVPAIIGINSGATYETGSSPTIGTSGDITANDETVFGSGSVRRDGLDAFVFSSGSFYSYVQSNVRSNATYQSFINVGNNGSPTLINSSTKNITFFYPYLYLLSSNSNITSSLYFSATKIISSEQNHTVNFVGAATYIYYAFPASYGNLSKILDPNVFIITSDFLITDMPITSTGLALNWTTTYRVYRTQNLSDPSGDFQFQV